MTTKMPSQSELRSTLATIIECPICCEMYTSTLRKPKLMTPCGHTLCLECGLTYCRHKSVSNPGERIACPVCRRGVRLPVGGFPALANNLTMMKLLDVRDVLIRCDSEAELRSAIEMLEGLLACENKMQCTIDEIEHVRDDIRAVLKRRRRSNSVSGNLHLTPSNDEVTPKTDSDSCTVVAGDQRRPLSISAPPPGRSASTGDVLATTSARVSGTSAPRTRLSHPATPSQSRSPGGGRQSRPPAVPASPGSPRTSSGQQQRRRSSGPPLRRRPLDSVNNARSSMFASSSPLLPQDTDEQSEEPLAASWLLSAPPPPIRVSRRASQMRVVSTSWSETLHIVDEVLRDVVTEGVAAARRLPTELVHYLEARSPFEILFIGFFVAIIGTIVVRIISALF